MKSYPSEQQLVEFEKMFTQMRIENWLHHSLFSFQWWLLLALLIIPWIIWWKFVDNKRITEITLYGLLVVITASYIDATVTELVLWGYKYKLIPLWHQLVPVNFSVLPVIYMFVYQYSKGWKSFFINNTIMAAVLSFMGEPLLVWLDIYQLYKWKYIYSFPIYIFIALVLRWVVKTILKKQAFKPI